MIFLLEQIIDQLLFIISIFNLIKKSFKVSQTLVIRIRSTFLYIQTVFVSRQIFNYESEKALNKFHRKRTRWRSFINDKFIALNEQTGLIISVIVFLLVIIFFELQRSFNYFHEFTVLDFNISGKILGWIFRYFDVYAIA